MSWFLERTNLSLWCWHQLAQLSHRTHSHRRPLEPQKHDSAIRVCKCQGIFNANKIFKIQLCTGLNVHFANGTTLESEIDVGQGINVGPGKFVKKNKRRALNKRRAWTKCAKLCYKKPIKLENICRQWIFFQNLINVGPLIRLYGVEKKPKLINIGPTFIPDYRVIPKMVGIVWKKAWHQFDLLFLVFCIDEVI